MTIDELRADIAQRIGQSVDKLLTREGDPAMEMTDLISPLQQVSEACFFCVMGRVWPGSFGLKMESAGIFIARRCLCDCRQGRYDTVYWAWLLGRRTDCFVV